MLFDMLLEFAELCFVLNSSFHSVDSPEFMLSIILSSVLCLFFDQVMCTCKYIFSLAVPWLCVNQYHTDSILNFFLIWLCLCFPFFFLPYSVWLFQYTCINVNASLYKWFSVYCSVIIFISIVFSSMIWRLNSDSIHNL